MHSPRLRSVVIALLVFAGLGAGVQLVCAQTLADVAKKEEERRKTIREPAKVYTNKDLTAPPPGSPQPVPVPAAADAASGDDKDKDAKPKDPKAPAKDQAYWSGRMKTLQTTADRDALAAEAMQTRVNSLITDFINRDDPAQKAVIAQNRDKAMAELTRLTKAVQDEKKAVADLQEEARRAGVPPGWLR